MRSLTVGMGSPFTPSPLGSVSTDGELDRLYTSTSPFLAASVHEDGTKSVLPITRSTNRFVRVVHILTSILRTQSHRGTHALSDSRTPAPTPAPTHTHSLRVNSSHNRWSFLIRLSPRLLFHSHTESMDSYMLDSADFDFKANLDAISVPMTPLDRAIGAPTIYTSAREFGPSDDCDYLGVESRWGTSGIASESAPVLPTRSSKKPSTTGKQGVKQKRAVNQQQQQEKKKKKKKPSSPEESGGLFSSAVDPMISTNALHDFNWATKPTPTKSKAGKASRTKKASARRSSAPRNEYLPHAAVGQPFAPQSFKPHGSYAAALIPIFADAKDVWSQALAQVEVGRPSQPSSASQPASKNRLKLPKPSGRPTASSRSVSFKAPKAPKASKASKAKATAARLPSVRPSATLTAASPPTSHPSIWQPSPSEKQKKMENKKNKKIPMQPGTPAVHAAAAAVALSEIVRERALPLPHELTIPVRNVIEIQSQLFHVGDVDHTHPHHSLIACYTNLHSSPFVRRRTKRRTFGPRSSTRCVGDSHIVTSQPDSTSLPPIQPTGPSCAGFVIRGQSETRR
jgi:hypothetical protein